MLALARSTASRSRPFAFSRGYASKRKTVKEHPNAQSLTDALHVLKAVEAGRPMHQYEIHVQCKIEKSTPLIRGSVMLPKGLKDESKVLVFAEAKKAEEARQAGAAYVGGADLIDQVQKGQVVFDKCIATPEMLPQVAKIARVLGPKGLMPTTKKGTVTDDILSTVQKARGSFDFKGDKQGVVHTGVGCISFEDKDVEANIRTILDEIRNFGRQHALKGMIRNVYISSTRGPGIPLSNASLL